MSSGTAQTADHGSDIVRVYHEAGYAVGLIYVLKNPLTLVLHPADLAAAQRTMKVVGPSGAGEGRCVLDAQTATSCDLNSSSSECDQLLEPVNSGQHIACAT
jgi:hypothetical protein